MAEKSLAIYLDGTWNKPSGKPNIWKLYGLLKSKSDIVNYEANCGEGVGTSMWQRVSGGAFAVGLSEDVLNVHVWLAS